MLCLFLFETRDIRLAEQGNISQQQTKLGIDQFFSLCPCQCTKIPIIECLDNKYSLTSFLHRTLVHVFFPQGLAL